MFPFPSSVRRQRTWQNSSLLPSTRPLFRLFLRLQSVTISTTNESDTWELCEKPTVHRGWLVHFPSHNTLLHMVNMVPDWWTLNHVIEDRISALFFPIASWRPFSFHGGSIRKSATMEIHEWLHERQRDWHRKYFIETSVKPGYKNFQPLIQTQSPSSLILTIQLGNQLDKYQFLRITGRRHIIWFEYLSKPNFFFKNAWAKEGNIRWGFSISNWMIRRITTRQTAIASRSCYKRWITHWNFHQG